MTDVVGAVPVQRPVGFVSSSHVNRNAKRIEEDEKELEELIKIQMGTNEDAPDEGLEEAPKTEAKKVVTPAAAETDDDEPLTAEEKSYKKRYGDLRRHMNELQGKIKELEEKGTTQKEALVPPKSEEEVIAWMKKFPDVAAIVEAIAERKATEKFSSAQDRLSQLDQLAADAVRSKAEAEIRVFHPDFDTLREKDEFHDWAEEQPKWIKDALYENDDDPASVVKVINLYKMEKGIDNKGIKEAAKKAVTNVVTKRSKPDVDENGNGKLFKESQVSRMSAHEYEKHQDEIMEAIRSGKFEYDISGAAR